MTPAVEALLREADNVNPPDRTIDEQRWAAQLIHDLARELRAALADAERYRWLRNKGDLTWDALIKRAPGIDLYIDNVIDAAREGK